MPSTEGTLDIPTRQLLLEVASASIAHGLSYGNALPIDPLRYPETLRVQRATFVTLQKQGELRGCIGTLEAHRPLVVDVAENAFAAAIRDPRFPPMQAGELPALTIHISILSPPTPLDVRDEADLLRQLRPGVDGLILNLNGRRGTFLPSVWASLPRPEQFLLHLKHKAGLAEDFWSREIQIQRYTTEVFPE